ncbi:MAG: chemotaxis protein CheW [Pseudomonadota bacterium]|nr:chemotaxis protein CheW [Pseudomonadota bacterium]
MEPAVTSSTERFLTFCVDRQLYALPAADVTEVMHVPALAHVPQAPAALLGVANLRGSVLPVASLRELLGKPAASYTSATRAVVLDLGAPVAVVVDSVETLAAASTEQIDAHKHELTAADTAHVLGAFTVGAGKTVARILDIKALLDAAFTSRARARRQAAAAATTSAPSRNEESSAAHDTEVFVTFEVAGQEFGLALEAVQEIIPAPESATAVARTDAAVLGVIAVRDALLPLLSLRGLLGLGDTQCDDAQHDDGREKIVVARVAGARVGLVADRARAIVVADAALVDPIPPVLAARTGGESRIKAIYRGDGGRRLISILSPEQLFREDVMQKLVADRKDHGADTSTDAQASSAERIFLVFRLGNDEFGLPIDTVVEVMQVPAQITRVPKAPKFLEGVVNLRGDVLPVVDQRRRFDMPKLDKPEGRRIVVIQTERHRAGLIVDSVADVLRVAPDAIEPPPALTDATSRLVRGVVNLEQSQRLVLVLDPAEVLTRAEQGLLDNFQQSSQASAQKQKQAE